MRQSLMVTAIDDVTALSQGCILVVSNSSETTASIDDNLLQQGFDVLLASEGVSALRLFEDKSINFILIEADRIDVPIDELVHTLRVRPIVPRHHQHKPLKLVQR